jgi:hypothetical protein
LPVPLVDQLKAASDIPFGVIEATKRRAEPSVDLVHQRTEIARHRTELADHHALAIRLNPLIEADPIRQRLLWGDARLAHHVRHNGGLWVPYQEQDRNSPLGGGDDMRCGVEMVRRSCWATLR